RRRSTGGVGGRVPWRGTRGEPGGRRVRRARPPSLALLVRVVQGEGQIAGLGLVGGFFGGQYRRPARRGLGGEGQIATRLDLAGGLLRGGCRRRGLLGRVVEEGPDAAEGERRVPLGGLRRELGLGLVLRPIGHPVGAE